MLGGELFGGEMLRRFVVADLHVAPALRGEAARQAHSFRRCVSLADSHRPRRHHEPGQDLIARHRATLRYARSSGARSIARDRASTPRGPWMVKTATAAAAVIAPAASNTGWAACQLKPAAC